ncbi:MAG: tRNA (adenosine(37)-N6)-dimethylallyltransferase MiaA [Reichenbachiella sp.]|uniref:tRNA (adenosine(37)-N6)-dimethylallyltransferase MiaA n=1 Tax=Reichenbachiella sp. TaxID=2184521 RepID=UPI003265191C
MSDKNLLVVVVGPTAVGKTAATISLAKHFNGEIISSDSRQFYKEMEIGTAKPNDEELSQVTHHFVNSHSINEDYDASTFADDAEELLEKLFPVNNVQFMVGGSGLYIKAFCHGLDEMPEANMLIRQTLNDELDDKGLNVLLNELRNSDPVFFEQVDRKNPQRVIRALEVIRGSGKPYSAFRLGEATRTHNFKILKIGLEMDRTVLYERIDRRIDEMITLGLFEEAKKLYPHREMNALQTVGYKEIFDHLDGKYDREEAVRLLKRNSRRYAKRQLTWFRKDSEISWFTPDQLQDIEALINQKIV